MEIAGKAAGSFIMELYPEHAPLTVTNFVKLVEDKFYDGLKFHRVIDGFMAQGGRSDEKTADMIKGEFAANGVENNLKHDRGIVSMARTKVYNSASSQFFICYSREKTQHLDGQYAAFGKVIEGMDVVDSFLEVELTYGSDGAKSAPVEDIVIKAAYIVK
ncbi:MAG: peptidylprolyl isomerase [Clostridia bacterium]|nr:peptidylprolyl isomerase [Clostridia bacterium]